MVIFRDDPNEFAAVRAFIAECVYPKGVNPGARTWGSNLYAAFKSWQKRNEAAFVSHVTFGRFMHLAGFERMKTGQGIQWLLCLKPESEVTDQRNPMPRFRLRALNALDRAAGRPWARGEVAAASIGAKQFGDECLEPSASLHEGTKANALYRAYVSWCLANEKVVVSTVRFARMLQYECGYARQRYRNWAIWNCRVKPDVAKQLAVR